MSTIDELAETIASLEPDQQKELLDKLAEINFRKGLESLSNRYRERLSIENALEHSADEIMNELMEIRERIASDEYKL